MTASQAPVVLIVEDEPIVRLDIVEEMRQASWQPLEASTAEAALEFLEEGKRVDLVVTDINLGSTASGWDIAAAYRVRYPEIPVVYATGNLIDPSRKVPGSVLLAKPCQPGAILRICKALISWK